MARALSLLFLVACHGAASEAPRGVMENPRNSAVVSGDVREIAGKSWGTASRDGGAFETTISTRDAGNAGVSASAAGGASATAALRNVALRSPLPGGTLAGYRGDTGLDIAADHKDVFAVVRGTLDYSEHGHTLWTSGKDTPNSVRLALETPIPWKGHKITHVYYTHMSRLVHRAAEGAAPRVAVEAGAPLGTSGIGNGMPHLHIGFILDGRVEQDSWDGLLTEGDVRTLFGGYRNGEKLP